MAAEAKRPFAVEIQASILGLVVEQATFADAQRALGDAESHHNRGEVGHT
jgi:hypothetical protein